MCQLMKTLTAIMATQELITTQELYVFLKASLHYIGSGFHCHAGMIGLSTHLGFRVLKFLGCRMAQDF